MGTKKVRKGPSASATAFSVGTKKKGSDGNYWIVVATKANVHKWQKIKNSTKTTLKLDSQVQKHFKTRIFTIYHARYHAENKPIS